MQVKSSEFEGQFEYANLEVISNNDSGLFAVQYSKQESLQKPVVVGFYDDHYRVNAHVLELAIVPPAPRKILRSLIIVKSSANCYRVAYADGCGSEQFVANSYNEIHGKLIPLWDREV